MSFTHKLLIICTKTTQDIAREWFTILIKLKIEKRTDKSH